MFGGKILFFDKNALNYCDSDFQSQFLYKVGNNNSYKQFLRYNFERFSVKISIKS